MPDPRRQLVGRRSKVSGETFERWISNACEFYLRNGWAHIEKTQSHFTSLARTEMELSKDITRRKDSLITKESSVMELGLCLKRSILTVTESDKML